MSDERLLFFGEPWGARMLEDAEQVPAPLGELCGWCEEPIEADDRGVLRPFVEAERSGLRPLHRECDARSVIGGINHMRGDCTCCGGSEPPDPPELTRRDAAAAAYQYLIGELPLQGVLARVRDRLHELGVSETVDMPGLERYLLICNPQAHLYVEQRPGYCDRGRVIVKVFPRVGSDLELSFDGQDGFPRYYFDPDACAVEIHAWMKVRGLL